MGYDETSLGLICVEEFHGGSVYIHTLGYVCIYIYTYIRGFVEVITNSLYESGVSFGVLPFCASSKTTGKAGDKKLIGSVASS